MDRIRIVISGPLRLRIGREIDIESSEGISIFNIIDILRERYEKDIGRGHQSFNQLMNQIIFLIDGKRWDKKEDIKVKPGTQINVIHMLNGG